MFRAAVRSHFAPITPSAAGPPQDAPSEAEQCVTCCRPANTPFCPHCGERRAADHAYTLRAMVADVWDHVTPADGKALRSVWTLVRRPGALTTAYMRGERRPYMAPLGLFLFVNAAYFVYVGATGQRIFNTPLQTHLTATAHSDIARRLVDRRTAARHVTYAQYERTFNATVDTQSRTLIAAMVPGFALFVALTAFRRGRGALHHLAFSFNAMSALLLSVMAAPYIVAVPLLLAVKLLGARHVGAVGDHAAGLIITTPFFVWVVLALRRAYGDGWIAAVIKAAVLQLGLLYVLFAYRALLFFTTFWAT